MLRIAVCDDILVFVEKMAEYIEMWAGEQHLNVQIKRFASGEDVIFEQEDMGDFAAIFMDIELSGMNGMEAVTKIREKNSLVSIVFVTQYEEYLKQVIRIYPCQYIDKPISKEKVFEAMDRIAREHKSYYEIFTLQYNKITINIALGEVLYFVSEKRKVKVVTENGEKYVFYQKLNEVEDALAYYNCQFLRIHQSYLVNCGKVREYHPRHIIMDNGDRLPISRFRCEQVKLFRMGLLS
ncbi:LytR/AlgR family response regulator transcription factor [Parablautia muri]|uniref:Stage 0 sporulation protein A homolog n=1 Tax=Parablautia muri TaxID=2320879 RepID=A0A9X5GV36_9FIRM|nr:LytTR family DNA-binding domain-containing protein [Parablautia muri]NBJ94737.1 DNA-binding response regulator [Parablautia muri]